MNAEHWLTKYPRAAAMLQGDEDVLLYEPQSARGLDEDPPRSAALAFGRQLAEAFLETLAAGGEAPAVEIDRGDW